MAVDPRTRMSQEGLRFPLGLSRSDSMVKTNWFQLVEKHFFSCVCEAGSICASVRGGGMARVLDVMGTEGNIASA